MERKQLFSVLLTPADVKRLEDIAKSKGTTKSGAFREWLRNAARQLDKRKES